MAVDTKQKRFSAMFVMSPRRGMAIVPTGTVTQAERQAAAFMYSGILAAGPTVNKRRRLLLIGAGQCLGGMLS